MKKFNFNLTIGCFIVFKFTKFEDIYYIVLLGYDVFHAVGDKKSFFNGKAFPRDCVE